jgi:hypothetical protein
MANELGKLTNITATGSTTARTLANRFADVVNVKDFGAVGNWNGTTGANDTAAFQAAIDFCEVDGKKLFIPSGNYLLDSLYINAVSGVVIEGESPAAFRNKIQGKGGGVRLFYKGSGDFLNLNTQTTGSFSIARVYLSNFTILFTQNTVNSAISIRNIQESFFKNIAVLGGQAGTIPNDGPSQNIESAFLIDSGCIVEFNSCLTSYVKTAYKITGQANGLPTGPLYIINCNHYRCVDVFTGGSNYYSINVFSSFFEGYQNAFLFDTSQSYNGISMGNINITNNSFLQSTLGVTNSRIIKVTSSVNSLPINFYINFERNFCFSTPVGVAPSNYSIEFDIGSNTSTVNGIFNCNDNLFWGQATAALTTDTNAIRFLGSGNDVRIGGYGSAVLPYCIAGTVSGYSSVTLASETADYSANNSTSEVVLKTINIPRDFLTAGRSLSLKLFSTYLNTTSGNKTLRIRIGGLSGATIATFVNTSIGQSGMDMKIGVTNTGFIRAVSTQTTDDSSVVPLVQNSLVAIPSGAIQSITITGQVASSSDNLALNMYSLSLE